MLNILFISIRFLDILDILLVAFLLYSLYNLIKGTAAINIFIAIFSFYMLWHIVKALNMQLLSGILGQIIGVGVIALIIVFQQEIRRFLLILGTRYIANNKFSLDNLFFFQTKQVHRIKINSIVNACINMSAFKIGALIVIAQKSTLIEYAKTGDIINADTSSRLLESIFFKNSPLHDGAVIIRKDKIYSARCIMPISERLDISAKYGMRHRAALGITEKTDAIVVVVSEETGAISFVSRGNIENNIGPNRLRQLLYNTFPSEQ
ncbi:MAG: diadenylate cyclase CdaA [Bacteroidales bacterium]|jgi:diadenylate cyclase|nr:diadenylate cyclase CdaA [Bacteroidales bacterium]